MSQLPKGKHPLISKRNQLVLQALDKKVIRRKVAEQFNLSIQRIDQIRREYRGQRYKTPRRLTKRDKLLIARDWKAGISRVDTAATLGVHPDSLKRVTRELGLRPRPLGFKPKKRTIH